MKPFYEDDSATIHHGDCLDIKPTNQKPKLILTDPPYATGKIQSRLGGESYEDKESAEEVSVKIETVCENWFGLGNPRTSWWANKHNHILTFTENETSGIFNEEHVPRTDRVAESKGYPSDKSVGSVWDYTFSNSDSERVKYPNQKPLKILNPFVQVHSNIGDLVFDPFMGSGSTGVSACNHFRKFIGCDLKEEACEIAVRRFAEPVLPLYEG